MTKIFIDPGHGGSNPGAIAASGLEEADVTLDIGLRLGRILKSRGYEVAYSRTEDVTVSLAERARLANDWGADYFISIHCNSNPNPEANGTSTYCFSLGTTAAVLAEYVNSALVQAIGTRDLGVLTANFAVLRRTRMPAILVETAFLSNPEEAAQLAEPSFREMCALGIADGIDSFMNTQ